MYMLMLGQFVRSIPVISRLTKKNFFIHPYMYIFVLVHDVLKLRLIRRRQLRHHPSNLER